MTARATLTVGGETYQITAVYSAPWEPSSMQYRVHLVDARGRSFTVLMDHNPLGA